MTDAGIVAGSNPSLIASAGDIRHEVRIFFKFKMALYHEQLEYCIVGNSNMKIGQKRKEKKRNTFRSTILHEALACDSRQVSCTKT